VLAPRSARMESDRARVRPTGFLPGRQQQDNCTALRTVFAGSIRAPPRCRWHQDEATAVKSAFLCFPDVVAPVVRKRRSRRTAGQCK